MITGCSESLLQMPDLAGVSAVRVKLTNQGQNETSAGSVTRITD